MNHDAESADSLLLQLARMRADLTLACAVCEELQQALHDERATVAALRDRVRKIRADYPSDVFPGDVGKGARMAIDRVLLLFAQDALY